jgi:hypothetical protein
MISYSLGSAVAVYYGHSPETVNVSDGVVTGRLSKALVNSTEPPHVALANALMEPKAVVAFTRKYGPVVEPSSRYADHVSRGSDGAVHYVEGRAGDAARALTPQDLLSLGADDAVRESFSLSINDFGERQDRLRLAWRGERTALEVLRQGVMLANFQVSLWGERSGGGNNVMLRTRLLWDYICLTFIIDYDTRRAKVCANRECETPYFIQQRTDKEFCSHRCAVEANNIRRAQQKRGGKK